MILLGAEAVFQIILKWFLGKDRNFNSIHLLDTDLVALDIYIFEGIGSKGMFSNFELIAFKIKKNSRNIILMFGISRV